MALTKITNIARSKEETISEVVFNLVVGLLADQDYNIRAQSATALGIIDKKHDIIVPKLINLLYDPIPHVREESAWALGHMTYSGDTVKKVVPHLISSLEDPDASVRIAAASGLGSFGGQSKAALPKLKKLLGSQDEKVRCESVMAIGEIGVSDKEAIDAVIGLLTKTKEPEVRYCCVFALGKIGRGSNIALKALRSCMNSCADNKFERELRLESAKSLWEIDPGNIDAINIVKDLIENSIDQYLEEKAVEILIEICELSEYLLESLQDNKTKLILKVLKHLYVYVKGTQENYEYKKGIRAEIKMKAESDYDKIYNILPTIIIISNCSDSEKVVNIANRIISEIKSRGIR